MHAAHVMVSAADGGEPFAAVRAQRLALVRLQVVAQRVAAGVGPAAAVAGVAAGAAGRRALVQRERDAAHGQRWHPMTCGTHGDEIGGHGGWRWSTLSGAGGGRGSSGM